MTGAASRGPLVAIVMGSASDLPLMEPAADMLAELGVAHEIRVVSAHRTPHDMLAFANDAARRGIRVIVAGAGGAGGGPGDHV
jgi:5-(carboxyamino)imidazole ribonucleotide mutase